MTVELAPQTGLPGRFLDDGYILPAGLPFERWCEIVGTLQIMERSVKWWVGDALLYGEAAYGEMASQAFPDAFSGTPYAEATLRAAMWVSERFPRGTRVEQLTWTHHRVVAELPPIEARRLLMAALSPVAEGKPSLSTRQLIDLRDRHKRQFEDHAATPEEPSLVFVPQLSDLTDEMREMFERRAAGVGKRHAIGYERGFLDGLLVSGVDGVFKQDEPARRPAHPGGGEE